MPNNRQESVQSLLELDTHFRRCFEHHRDLDLALRNLRKKHYLTVDEQAEINHLKKLKLQRKDEMEAMLVAYESGVSASQNRKRPTAVSRSALRT